jgi:hypothetical protein
MNGSDSTFGFDSIIVIERTPLLNMFNENVFEIHVMNITAFEYSDLNVIQLISSVPFLKCQIYLGTGC